MNPENINNPFLQITVRSLLLRFFLITIPVGFGLGAVQKITGVKFDLQILTLIIYILQFGLICLWMLADFERLGVNLSYVVGRVPRNQKWLPLVGLVVLMLLFSLSAALVSFYLLSWVAPSFVQGILEEVKNHPSPKTSAPLFSNLLGAIAMVVIAPITEEFLFRGIILQRWATKWGIRSGLVISSILFGIGHPNNVVGLSVFGMIMGVLYLKSRTLIVPIACHALNNFLALAMGLLPANEKTASTVLSLEELRSSWWVGVVLMLISLPVVVRFLSKNWPRKDAVIPYFINLSQGTR